jgi:hypothetical protein
MINGMILSRKYIPRFNECVSAQTRMAVSRAHIPLPANSLQGSSRHDKEVHPCRVLLHSPNNPAIPTFPRARAWPAHGPARSFFRLRLRARGAVSKVHICAPMERQHRRKVRLPARAAVGASSAPTSLLLVPQTCGCSACLPYARCEDEGPFEQGVRAGRAHVRTHAAGCAYSPNRRRAGRRGCMELTGVCVMRKP